MIKIVIVEDHHLVREGIKSLLEKDPEIQVVGEAADGYEAVGIIERLKPDVAVIDISLPKLNGNQVIQKICACDDPPQSIVLSMYSDPALVRAAFRNGAKAYIVKQTVFQELLFAIKAVAKKQNYISPGISDIFLDEFVKGDTEFASAATGLLTPRETEILQLIAEGHGNNSIAGHLNISIKTVEKHKSNIMSKLQIGQTAGLVKYALKQGLIFLE